MSVLVGVSGSLATGFDSTFLGAALATVPLLFAGLVTETMSSRTQPMRSAENLTFVQPLRRSRTAPTLPCPMSAFRSPFVEGSDRTITSVFVTFATAPVDLMLDAGLAVALAAGLADALAVVFSAGFDAGLIPELLDETLTDWPSFNLFQSVLGLSLCNC